jgi:hypothetical protein
MPPSELFIMAAWGFLPLGQKGYLPTRKVKLEYQCRTDPQFLDAWGQPMIYSRGALEKVYRGLRLEGVTKQCEEYSVLHDVGNAILHWMYSLPELRIRITDTPKNIGDLILSGCMMWRGTRRMLHLMKFKNDSKRAKASSVSCTTEIM